jgi:hypothetical protein
VSAPSSPEFPDPTQSVPGAVLTAPQADALLARLHTIRRATDATRHDAIRMMAEALYVLAGWAPPEVLSVPDPRLTDRTT